MSYCRTKNKPLEAVWASGGSGLKPQNGKTKISYFNTLEYLKSHFIKPQLTNTFLIPLFFMCFEINGLKSLKSTILRF